MEGCALQSPIITIVSSYIPRTPSRFQTIKFPNAYRYPNAQKKFRCFSVGAQASGATKSSSGTTEAITKKVDMKDENLAFVAGATGKVGSRLVRELLKLGFRVRAGVRSAERAQTLVQNVRQMKIDTENTNEGIQPVEKLEIVECDLEKRDQIGKALGNASVVLCCIGASEKEVFDITGPYRIDYLATKNLIEAATVAKVNHFILLTSLGTNKVGFPAAILNLFWGVLIWKRKAEEALIASGVPYTIVRPGGMERPTDAYKETHNITLSLEDTLFGGQVSNLQVAELMASMAKNRGLSYCKVVEAIAETTAPLKPMEELLKKIPSQRSGFYSVEEPSSEKRLDSVPSKEPSTSYEDLKAPISPTKTTSISPAASKASETGAMPASSTSTSLQEISGTVAEGEGQQTEVKKERPLSPYPFYENLKPPTSPSPTAPGIQGDSSNADATSELTSDVQSASIGPATDVTNTTSMPHQVSMERPLSPYVVYEDLKPPSSPTPKPSGPVDMASAYDKVKPPAFPSSDTPIVPPFSPSPDDSGPEISTGIVNSTGKDQTDDEPIGNEEYHSKPKPKPLSPFTMYEDLKPPASPSPSPRRY